MKPSGQRRAGMDGCGVVGGAAGWQEQAVIDERRCLSDRHSEAGTPGLGPLQLTGSSGCQAPVGNHLPQQLDYLFLRQDAEKAPFPPSFKAPPHHAVFLLSLCVCS